MVLQDDHAHVFEDDVERFRAEEATIAQARRPRCRMEPWVKQRCVTGGRIDKKQTHLGHTWRTGAVDNGLWGNWRRGDCGLSKKI